MSPRVFLISTFTFSTSDFNSSKLSLLICCKLFSTDDTVCFRFSNSSFNRPSLSPSLVSNISNEFFKCSLYSVILFVIPSFISKSLLFVTRLISFRTLSTCVLFSSFVILISSRFFLISVFIFTTSDFNSSKFSLSVSIKLCSTDFIICLSSPLDSSLLFASLLSSSAILSFNKSVEIFNICSFFFELSSILTQTNELCSFSISLSLLIDSSNDKLFLLTLFFISPALTLILLIIVIASFSMLALILFSASVIFS